MTCSCEICRPIASRDRDPRHARYGLSALSRTGMPLGLAELDHPPTERELALFKAHFPQTPLEWVTVRVDVRLP